MIRRLGQVFVQLPHVLRVWFAAAGGANPVLELDEGIQSGQVYGTARGIRGRVLLNNLLAAGQAGEDEKVPDRAGDVSFGLKVVMAQQDLRRCITILGVVYVYV